MNKQQSVALNAALAAAYAAGVGDDLMRRVVKQKPNPWGPPSKKPEHLRDDGDRARLAAAAARRARKAKFRHNQTRWNKEVL